MSIGCQVASDAGCSGHLKTDCSFKNTTCFMQLKAPLDVLIVNGPGIRQLIRTVPFHARPEDEFLEWEMVTKNADRFYINIRPKGRKLSDHGPRIKVVGKIIGWGFPERTTSSQNDYSKFTIVIEAQNVDEEWYYYVGNYQCESNRFGEGKIYTYKQYQSISVTCPRENPPERIWAGEDISIVTSVKQPVGCP